ncbi:protein-export chaperone SecB [Sphingomonas sp.]|uniref:protein-export chaperone SecB n=1 Tax=Sphingomonas sp. TaxID=28214 RepID=UPI00178EAE0E|nr:protein-export chaperone SecB [Sphingomonas sp.]
MADQDPINRGNGSGDPDGEPQVMTIAQYIKDLSVESPSSPQAFQWQAQPQLDVQFNINVDKVADEVHEVVLKIEVAARSDQGVHFLIDLSYAGVYGIRNLPEEALPPFLLIEAPRLLFPFARQIIADCSQNTGFPPLMLDPIDFGAAYMAQLQATQPGEDGTGGNGGDEGQGSSGSDAEPGEGSGNETEPADASGEKPQG